MNDCQHPSTTITPTPQGPHHAKETCELCGKFIRWVSKPQNLQKAKDNEALCRRLAGIPLSDWDKEFLLSLEKQAYRLSPKQQVVLDRLVGRLP